MGHRVSMDGKAAGLMVMLCAIWGLQQVVLKAAAPDMPPVLQISLRSGAAIVLVGMYLRFRGLGLLPGRGALPAGLLAGLLFSLEYLFVGEGLRFTSASHMAVMLYTAPAFAALGLHWRIPEERLNRFQWTGICLAICGVAVALYAPSPATDASFSDVLLGDFLGLLAGMSWGATTVVIRCSRLAETPAAQTVSVQLLVAFLFLLAASMVTGQASFTLSRAVLVSLAYQTLLVSFVSLLLWFWLLRVYLASQLGVLSFLTPLFGVIFGVALLGEDITLQFVAGAVMILAGILLVSGWRILKAFVARDRPGSPRG